MKRQMIMMTLVAGLAFLLAPMSALAIDPPHSIITNGGYKCAYCHTTNRNKSLGNYMNNICLVCHSTGTGDPASLRKAFTRADIANPFRTMTTATANAKQTTHNFGATDNNPKAGAQPPLNSTLNKTQLLGKVSCVRCHAIKNPKSSVGNSYPFIRVLNDKDQLCLDCHRSWNTRDHTTGTHPVNFNYTGATSKVKQAAYTTSYYKIPQNSNPANPTSNLNNYLKGGTLVCSTCHGTHNADSSSRTYDNYTTSNDPLTMDMQPNKRAGLGMLLRTDMRSTPDYSGPTGNNYLPPYNICQNCHVRENHNSKNQNVQCTDCHSSHVGTDFKGNMVSTPLNVWLLARYINYSSVVAGQNVRTKPIFFTNVTTNRGYYRGDGTGLCEVCHNTLPQDVDSHKSTAALNGGDSACRACHNHKTGSFRTDGKAACGTCHGRPPELNVPGNAKYGGTVGGYAVYTTGVGGMRNYSSTGYYKRETMTPHMRHSEGYYDNTITRNAALSCDECHKGNSHRNKGYKDVFKNVTGGFKRLHVRPGDARIAFKPVAGYFARNFAKYTSATTADGTCSNVYCHSNGAPRNTAFNIYTGMVYNSIPLWSGATANNGKGSISAAKGNRCSACHAAKPATNSHSKHYNVNTGNATMGATINCNVCHQTTMSLANYTSINHQGLAHSNGYKDVAFSAPYNTSMNWFEQPGTCTGACHSDGIGASGGTNFGLYTTAFWGVTPASRCGQCHGFPPKTGAHTRHMPSNTSLLHQSYTSSGVWSVAGDYVFGCANCHPKDLSKHINGVVEVTLNKNNGGKLASLNTVTDDISGYWRNSGKFYCFASYCHSNGGKGGPAPFRTYSSPDWYGTFSGDKCAMCHGNSPNSGGKIGSPAHYNTNSMGTGKAGGHFVGIHYDDIYTGGTGTAGPGNGATNSHGNSTYSTTIDCTTCHSSTVDKTVGRYNDKNVVCVTCHSSGNGGTFGHGDPALNKLNHLNGLIDVAFDSISSVRSKAQIKQTSFDSYSAAMKRNGGYKVNGSFDRAKQLLNTGTMWNSSGRTCGNIACHNGVSIQWDTDMTVNTCANCHTSL